MSELDDWRATAKHLHRQLDLERRRRRELRRFLRALAARTSNPEDAAKILRLLKADEEMT